MLEGMPRCRKFVIAQQLHTHVLATTLWAHCLAPSLLTPPTLSLILVIVEHALTLSIRPA